MARRTRALWILAALLGTAAGAAFLVLGAGRADESAAGGQAASASSRPGLRRTAAPATEDLPETPPDCDEPSDAPEVDPEAAFLASLPKEDPVRVRFVVAGTTSGFGRSRWSVVAEDADHMESGRADEEGYAVIPGVAVALWARWPMSVESEWGCILATLVRRPDLSGPRPVEIALSVRSTARFEGAVIDDLGNPIPSATVVVREFESQDTYRTTTDAEGRFEFSRPTEDRGADETIALDAVAPGQLVSSLEVSARGASNLVLRLEPDTTSGSAEVRLLASDGSPAAGARIWMHRAGEPTPWDRTEPPPEGREARTRTLLAAAAHALNPDDAGFEFSDQDNTVYVLDGVADAAGVLRVPACAPGLYRLYGVLGSPEGALRASAWSRGLAMGSLRVREVLDDTVEIGPPPMVSRATLSLRVARTVTGSVRVERSASGWTCGVTSHAHDLSAHGWLWMGGALFAMDDSAAPSDGSRLPADGPFRLDGMPVGAFRLHVKTPHHADALVDVPAAADGQSTTDVGTILVPDGRMVSCDVQRAGGGNLPAWSVRLEGYEGRFELKTTMHWIGVGAPSYGDETSDSFTAFLDRPPSPTTVAVLMFEVTPPHEVRLPFRPAPDEYGHLHADLVLPAAAK